MKLFTSPTTPYGRKVRIVATIKGVDRDIAFLEADTNPPGNAELMKHNPLGKIPVLVLDDGTRVFDSRVICEHLDTLGGPGAPRMFPEPWPERMAVLTLGALADGIAEAGILIFYESRFRPVEQHNGGWLARQQTRIDSALDFLDADPPAWKTHPDYGHIALAAALGHLDLRHGGRWRKDRPRLTNWLDHFGNEVPSYAETTPPA
ncbi:MAG: glutathione S-transferase N-terminal domain-containing protein [Hyphomicrobiaceae bacterium]|nr:glutathione S-transferase N-terminal domain-containing protein [Hyphomicrobiaceae bacterium]